MKRNDLSRALVAFDQDSTIVAVVELSLNTWLVSGLLPGVMRQPLKKQPADPDRLLAPYSIPDVSRRPTEIMVRRLRQT